MAKWQLDAMLDAGLAYISSNVTQIFVCDTQPTTYAEASSTYALTSTETPTFTGPANGDASGRKLTIDEEADMTITSTGTALHVALTSADTLIYVTTCTSQALTSGGTVTIPAWDIEIADAT